MRTQRGAKEEPGKATVLADGIDAVEMSPRVPEKPVQVLAEGEAHVEQVAQVFICRDAEARLSPIL